MHLMPVPRWLMIVSTATAVLPVWRSPIISSRWPRPIGIIESTDFRPVCTGWPTDWRVMTPGATFSIGEYSLVSTGPLPSTGLPRASTTRPSRASPTGTSRIRPVALTTSPSVMWRYSLRITAPTESCSRFRARPYVSPGNSSISPYCAPARPWIRQMPSVTDTTVPTSTCSAAASKFSMRCRIRSLISLAFKVIPLPVFYLA